MAAACRGELQTPLRPPLSPHGTEVTHESRLPPASWSREQGLTELARGSLPPPSLLTDLPKAQAGPAARSQSRCPSDSSWWSPSPDHLPHPPACTASPAQSGCPGPELGLWVLAAPVQGLSGRRATGTQLKSEYRRGVKGHSEGKGHWAAGRPRSLPCPAPTPAHISFAPTGQEVSRHAGTSVTATEIRA